MKKLFNFFLILIFLGFLSESVAVAETKVRLNLSDVVELAGQRELGLLLASERIYESIALKRQAYSAFAPQVAADVSYKKQTRDLKSQGIELPGMTDPVVGPFNSFDARIRLNQMLFDAASIERLLTVRDGEAVSRAQYRKAKEDAMALVASFYLEAQIAEEKIELSKAGFQLAAKRLRVTHRAFRHGKTTRSAVYEVKAAFKEVFAFLGQSKIQYIERIEDLKTALGFSVKDEVRLDKIATLSVFKIPTTEDIISSIQNHPDLEVAKKLVRQRESEQRIQWTEYFPKFSFIADFGLNGNKPSDSEETYMLGVQGSMPLFDGGQRFFKKEEFDSKIRQAKLRSEDSERKLASRAVIAAKQTNQSLLILESKNLQLLASSEEKRFAEGKFNRGFASDLELEEALYRYAQAREERNQAVNQYLLSRIAFSHAVGRMEDFIQIQKKA